MRPLFRLRTSHPTVCHTLGVLKPSKNEYLNQVPFFENYNSSPFWFVSHCDLWEGYTKNRQNDRHSFPSSERETKNQNGDEILEDLKSGTFQKMCICVLACSIPPLPLSGTPKKTWCVDFLLFLCTPPVVSHVVHTVYVNVYIPWYSTRYTPI